MPDVLVLTIPGHTVPLHVLHGVKEAQSCSHLSHTCMLMHAQPSSAGLSMLLLMCTPQRQSRSALSEHPLQCGALTCGTLPCRGAFRSVVIVYAFVCFLFIPLNLWMMPWSALKIGEVGCSFPEQIPQVCSCHQWWIMPDVHHSPDHHKT